MLFDLFARIDFTVKPAQTEHPFDHIHPYTKLQYREQRVDSDVAQVLSLHKGAKDRACSFQDEELEVYIFGYCFTKLKSSHYSGKQRLSARQIAKTYRELGEEFLHEIKGSFSILLLDKKSTVCQVFTDPFNVRPIYYCVHENSLIISTALQAIVWYRQKHQLPNDLNYPAIIEYYLFEYTLNDDTHVKSVQAMPPGGWLTFSAQGATLQNYWNAFDDLTIPKTRNTEKESVVKLEKVLKDNLNLHLFHPERTAVALTGGYDSRTNLALLERRAKDYFYYSYGIKGTYDLSIPQQIAKSQQLNYKSIFLDQSYLDHYDKYADLAIGMGDGIAEASRANYPYAFHQLSPRYDYILTGLFGSELIKHPTSIGNFINQDMKNLLQTGRQEQCLDQILAQAKERNFFDRDLISQYQEEVKERVLSNPYIVNAHAFPIKYFYFLLMQGIRKYFMKEIKVERPFVSNLHPFLDVEFVELLLKTPFPWIYHWTGSKNLLRSQKTHRFYVSMIQRNNPALALILSTHGYTPAFVKNKFMLPIMAIQYKFYKNKISSKGSFNSVAPMKKYFQELNTGEDAYHFIHPDKYTDKYWKEEADTKNLIKLASLQQWLNVNDLKSQTARV